MYKKFFALLLALSMALSLAGGVCAAGTASGSCGENAIWSFSDGTLTISGTGPMQDFRSYDFEQDQDIYLEQPWDAYRQDIRRIVVGEGITHLGSDAFVNLTALETVELPSTLTSIGNFVFCGCTALRTARLPENLTSIGQQAFWCCKSLKSVEIPASVTFVDANAFEDCTSLTDVYFHSDPDLPSFTSGNSIFRNCTALKEIRVEEGHIGLKSIDGALYFYWWDSGAMALNSYPAGRESADLRIADNTILIEQSALYNNPHLRNVIIPDTVTKIGANAFMGSTNLQSVKFEGSAPEIQNNVFFDSHVTILYPAVDPSWDNRGQWSDEYLTGPRGSVTWLSYTPETAKGICGDNAAWSYKNGKLTISGTGEMYDKWTIDNEQWFSIRDQITRVVVEEGITYIGSHSFGWCRNLTEITLSDTVTGIGDAAFFYCEALERVDLPETLSSIGDNAFGHAGLKEIDIPEYVTFLGANAFGDCESLTDVLVRGNPDLPGMTTGNSVFLNCDSLAQIQVEESHPFLRSIDGCLYIEDWDGSLRLNSYPAGRTERSLAVAERTISIEQYAFRGAEWLEQVEIPAAVTSVGSGTFQDVDTLKQVTFAGSAPEFGNHVFDNCVLEVRYPVGDSSWDGRENWTLGGSITWTPYNPNCPFTDVPVGEYYEAPVLWAVEKGITNGTSPTRFSPDKECTRAQVVTFLWRAVGCPEPQTTSHSFTDLKPGEYYEKAVLWAVENGITNGTSPTTFRPDKTCTRGQVVTFLWRAAECLEPESDSHPFTDLKPGEYYEKAVLWAVENGITNGTSPITFSPDKACTRGQVVTFLYRANN